VTNLAYVNAKGLPKIRFVRKSFLAQEKLMQTDHEQTRGKFKAHSFLLGGGEIYTEGNSYLPR